MSYEYDNKNPWKYCKLGLSPGFCGKSTTIGCGGCYEYISYEIDEPKRYSFCPHCHKELK